MAVKSSRKAWPSLIGLAINIFMHGLSTLQMYLYYTSYKNSTAPSPTYYIYNVLVINFGMSSCLALATRRAFCVAAGHWQLGLVSVAVQHFFAWRVHLANLAGSLGAAVSLAINPSIFLVPDLQIEVTIWLVGAVLADTIIAAALVWHLGRHKHLYPALTSTINRILRMTVQTGLVTTIVAIINLVCYLSNSMGAYAVFSMILSKLYTNCMLSTLNARKAWKYDGSSDSEASHGNGDHSGRTQPEVFVQVESYQKTDTDEKPAQGVQYL
ncbi:hypothetical protein EDD16DRAFT_1525512 [Pisolithus croceorrhizus]|nr:hypothetical protein EDD16DRAFT_1525512 [Pisolithus croceorrhizus]